MPSLGNKFKKWLGQDVHNASSSSDASIHFLSPFTTVPGYKPGLEGAVAVTLLSRPHELHDCRMRPKGQIADLIMDVVTSPSNASVPVQTVFELVDMIKSSYHMKAPEEGALRAAQALHFRLYSNDHTRVHHTLVVMDILYRNCGIIFVANIALYAGLLKNFIERQTTSQSNMELCIRLITDWQTIAIDGSTNVIFTDFDPIAKMGLLFESLVKAKYPIPAKSLEKIQQVAPARLAELQKSGNSKPLGQMWWDLHFSTYKPGKHVVA
ncbi:hypothetical protein HDU98_005573 [Podochytrium sp. JEL0797]|nr:hypothetical protein HDU98_005573 [Podochytrium sp. JEL0797]